MVEQIRIDLIDPNPWQQRLEELPEHVAALAESIREQGLLQIPSGRRHPDDPNRLQLAFGHSRLAAYRLLHTAPDVPDTADTIMFDARYALFPVNVVELNDRQMADAAAAENTRRKDLSAIELATAIRRYLTDFQVTQEEAGRVYGYANQGSVSNLLRLLDLSRPIQMMIHHGQLAEHIARMLIAVARWDAGAAEAIAQQVIKDEHRSDQPSYCEALVDEFYRKSGKEMRQEAIFDLEWPAKPLAVPDDLGIKNAPTEVPTCKGCPFRVKGRWSNEYCMRPACLAAKNKMHARKDAKTIAKGLGIPLATEGEKLKLVYKGDWNDTDLGKALIKSKHDSLRIVEYPKADFEGGRREEVLGGRHVALATVDPEALQTDVAAARASAERKANARENSWERDQERRRERERKLAGLAVAAAPIFAPVMPTAEPVLQMIFETLPRLYGVEWKDLGYPNDEAKLEAAFAKADRATKQQMISLLILVHHYEGMRDQSPDLFVVWVEQQAAAMKLRLPPKWSEIGEQTEAAQPKKKTAKGKPKSKAGKAKK